MKCFFTFLFLFFTVIQVSAKQLSGDCLQQRTESHRYNYCIYHDSGSKAQDVIYYFHGINRDETAWEELTFHKRIINTWKSNRGYTPYVISISFGSEWTLTDTSKHGDRFTVFVNKIMPELESKLPGTIQHRYLIGESMGGLNASLLWLRNSSLFEKVSIACPAITPVGPYSSSSEVNKYIEQSGASSYMVDMLMEVGRKEFANQNEWLENSPLNLTLDIQGKKLVPIMISVGDQDELGFQLGSKIFYEQLKNQNVDAIFDVISGGGHCSSNLKKISEFLLK